MVSSTGRPQNEGAFFSGFLSVYRYNRKHPLFFPVPRLQLIDRRVLSEVE